MKDLWQYLSQIKKPVVLYGMGNGADKIITELDRFNIKVSGVFASDGFVRKKLFHGMPVTDYKTAKETFGDMIVLVAFGSALPDVINNVKRISKEQESYIPDVPVYGDNLFDINFAKKHKEELKNAYDLLADDFSKKVFENTVYYKLTGKPEYLFESETSISEMYKLFQFKCDETYLDLGAYNGDTVKLFTEHTKGYNKIFAVEPDVKSFRKLSANLDGLQDVHLFNACIGSNSGTSLFAMRGGRNSSVSNNHGTETPCLCIDDILKGQDITFIKFDIEGNESAAIDGGKITIASKKPKMLIAAYHRSEDIFQIPIKIYNLNKAYKILLRHNPCFPCWDTNYIFI